MFPLKDDLPLDMVIRVYPHQQDTGAFFIVILEKKCEIKVRQEEKPAVVRETPISTVEEANGETITPEASANSLLDKVEDAIAAALESEAPAKRKRSGNEEDAPPMKQVKSEEPSSEAAVQSKSPLVPDVSSQNGQKSGVNHAT